MSSVLDVIAAINALLPSDVSVQVGPEHKGSTRPPPRIVWLPVSDSFTAPPNSGARPRRVIHTVQSTWEVILFAHGGADGADWPSSFRPLEALRDRFLGAVHAVCRGNATITSGRFDQQDGGAISKHGRTYTLHVQFSLEVLALTANPVSLAPIEERSITGEIHAAFEVSNGNT